MERWIKEERTGGGQTEDSELKLSVRKAEEKENAQAGELHNKSLGTITALPRGH